MIAQDVAALQPEADTLEPLVLDLLAWLASAPRPYAEVMEAWRTSCPRLPVWETAVDEGLVKRGRQGDDGQTTVMITPLGLERLGAAA